MSYWKCACGCGHVVEADKPGRCCGKLMVKASKNEVDSACSSGSCCC